MQCQKCGYCCRTLILEAEYTDGLREPRIFKEGMMLNLDDPFEERLWSLNGKIDWACIFLDRSTNLCTIYDTRPLMCQGFEAGNDQRCGLCDGHQRESVGHKNILADCFAGDGDPIGRTVREK